mmetsp:Transcript_50407/g.117013  ORF Transcript_50407/g.117013 Transcript_50407/m.117013 type:complete len:551 (-) Transcript_50407:181-1833(-)
MQTGTAAVDVREVEIVCRDANQATALEEESQTTRAPSESAESSQQPSSDIKGAATRGFLPSALHKTRLLLKVLGLGAMFVVVLISLLNWPAQLIEDEVTHRRIMSALFLIGLFFVAVEDILEVDKSAVMLILAAAMWVFTAASYHPASSQEGYDLLHEHLKKGLQDVGSIILFLLPAMGVVESIDHYGGFSAVTYAIQRIIGGQRDRLMPIICLLCFFMSSVVDNLTATIVAVKILRHLVPHDEEWRRLCGGLAVLAANAGGAWSPIGDVTTTMLWVQNKITSTKTVASLFLPSFVAGIFPLAGLWFQARRAAVRHPGPSPEPEAAHVQRSGLVVLVTGIACILMVPVLKAWTGLPPYLGMLLALGIVWVIADSLELSADGDGKASVQDCEQPQQEERGPRGGVPAALHQVDLTGLLFFTGVLLAVVALDSAGVLMRYARFLEDHVGENPTVLCGLLGISSAIVDNVPLVEAAIEMFDEVPTDAPLWQLLALTAGTGGSILSIGSIAGVTLMGMEGVGFLWYLRKISLWAFIGFALGIGMYELQRALIPL